MLRCWAIPFVRCTAHHTQISLQMVYSTPYSNLVWKSPYLDGVQLTMSLRQCTTHHISPQTVYNTPYLPTDGVQHTISPHRWCTAHHTQISPQMVYSTPYPNLPSDGVQHTILKSPLRWCTAHHTQIPPQMVYNTPYSNLPSDSVQHTIRHHYYLT